MGTRRRGEDEFDKGNKDGNARRPAWRREIIEEQRERASGEKPRTHTKPSGGSRGSGGGRF